MKREGNLEALFEGEAGKQLAWAFLKALKERNSLRELKPLHSAPKRYTTYVRHYHCRHCGASWTSACEIGKGQSLAVLGAGGEVTTMGYRGDRTLEVTAFCTRCDRCKELVRSWSREVLEEQYLHLLSLLPFSEKVVGERNCVLTTSADCDKLPTQFERNSLMPPQLSLWGEI